MNGISGDAERSRHHQVPPHHRPKMNGDTHQGSKDKKPGKPQQPPPAPSNGPRNNAYNSAQNNSNMGGNHGGSTSKNNRTPPNTLIASSGPPYNRHATQSAHHQQYSQTNLQQSRQYQSHGSHSHPASDVGPWSGSSGGSNASQNQQQSRQDAPSAQSVASHYRFGGSHGSQHSYPPPSSYHHAHSQQTLSGSSGLIHVSPASATVSPSVVSANQTSKTANTVTTTTTTGASMTSTGSTVSVAAVTTSSSHSPSPATLSTVTSASNTASSGPSPSAASSSGRASGGPSHYPGSPSSHSGEQFSKTNLYIRGLSVDATDAFLHQLCKQYGRITSTKAIIDKDTGKCKGYGFVDFENAAAAEESVKGLQAKGIQAQMAKQQEPDPTNLYFANLPSNMNEDELKKLLQEHGVVTSTRILRENNESKCAGFARMKTTENCEQIIQKFNKQMIPGCREPLLVKFADSANKKRDKYKNKEARGWDRPEMSQMYDQSIAQNGSILTSVQPGAFRGYQQPPYPHHVLPFYYLPPQAQPVSHVDLSQLMPPPQVDPNQLAYSNSMVHLNHQLSQLHIPVSSPTYVATNPPYGPYGPMLQHIPVQEDGSMQGPEDYASSYTPNSAAPNVIPQHHRY